MVEGGNKRKCFNIYPKKNEKRKENYIYIYIYINTDKNKNLFENVLKNVFF
jgi:hypothetical protein